MKKSILLMTALTLSMAVHARDFEKKTFKSAVTGAELLYRQLSPEAVDAGKQAKNGTYPLVLFLHGAGERGSDNTKQLVHGSGMFLNPANAEKYPAYVIFPQCPENLTWAYDAPHPWGTMPWDLPADAPESTMMKLLVEFLRDFLATHPDVNTSKVYVMGLSMGGLGTYDITSRYPELFTAAVPMCGNVNPAKVVGAKSVKFSIYHGDKDNVVPVEGSREAYRALRASGAKVRYKEFVGCGHGCWDPTFNEPDLLPWLFKQKK